MSTPDARIDEPRVHVGRKAVRNAVVAVLLILAGLAAWRFSSDSQLGRIELVNDGVPLMAQVFPEVGNQPLGEPFDLVTRSTLTLPDGDYRLRVNGVGRLGRTFRFAVNRGETQSHAVSLDEGRLLGGEPIPRMANQEKPREQSIPFAMTTVAIALTPGKTDLIELTGETIVRRDGLTGKPIWDALRPSIPRKLDEEDAARLRRMMEYSRQHALVQPAPDLDGDGTGDLVVASQYMTTFLALSGQDGRVLWEHTAELGGSDQARTDGPEWPGPIQPARRPVFLVNTPGVADLDRDGTPDLVATLIFNEFPMETERRSLTGARGRGAGNPQVFGRRMIQAIAGRSGRSLWRYPLDPTFRMASYPDWSRSATPVHGRGSSMVAIVDGAHWIRLDPITGRRLGQPIDLGFVPIRPVEYVDLNGDGEPEILALGPGQAAQQLTLAAFATGTGQPLWVATIKADSQSQFGQTSPPDWPFVVNLDGDGRSEIAVPDSGPMAPGDGHRGVQLIDGATGGTRWVRPMRPETKGQDGLIQVLDAPDLDHDGVRDLVATSFFLGRYVISNHEGTSPVPERVYVDALSGKDGHPLWWWHMDAPTDGNTEIWPIHWWGRGPDGWPILAVPLGANRGQPGAIPYNDSPIVYNLEASTGREVHAVAGLTRVGVADLDGDGLLDLWGEADGQLRAFRGEAPEAWRTLGSFGAAREGWRWDRSLENPAADLDGDGIADTLIAGPRAALTILNEDISGRALGSYRTQGFARRNAPAGDPIGTRTAIARSGRDGHAIWKTELDPRRIWYERDHGEFYNLSALSLPNGDLDGDGTPEVIVQKNPGRTPGALDIKRRATLPLQVLSGRTGQPLWSAGPLPLGFEAYGYSLIHWFEALVVEPNGAPDLLVRHGSPFAPARTAPMMAGSAPKPRLARVSGRDGRILWDLPLSEHPDQNNLGQDPTPGFGDLDGDGALDVVLVLRGSPGSAGPDHEVRVVSLRDGKLIGSHQIEFNSGLLPYPQLAIADLDGDKRPEVLVGEQSADGQGLAFVLKALDVRDGEPRWTWEDRSVPDPGIRRYWSLHIAHLDGNGQGTVCLDFIDSKGAHRLLTLDAHGQQRSIRELTQDANASLKFADINGDGRDELLLLSNGERIQALDRDLKELWSRPAKNVQVEDILPASSGQPATVVISPARALDGANGQPRWLGYSPHMWGWGIHKPSLLDPGHRSRLPLLISSGLGETVCRSALTTDSRGTCHPPRGAPVPPGLARNDPRWTRPLPWTIAVAPDAVRTGLLAVTAMALINLGIPLAILRLSIRRRRWGLQLLMALPIAAAVPLTVFLAVEPLIPSLPAPLPGSARILFAAGTLVGIPVVACRAMIGWALVRRRWKTLSLLVGLTILMSLILGAVWLWWDHRTMPAIDHYSWSGWYLVIIPGFYAVGGLMLIGWAIGRSVRLVTRLGRTGRHATSLPGSSNQAAP